MGWKWKTLENLLRKAGAIAVSVPLIILPGCEKPKPEEEPPKDTTPPEITINSPLENVIYNSKKVLFSGSIKEPNFDKAEYSTDNGQTKIPLGKTWSDSLSFTNGNQKVTVYASDKYSNSSTSSIDFVVNYTEPPKDVTPPKITINSPEKNKTYNTNPVSFTWNIEDEHFAGAWEAVDNGNKISIAKSGSENKTFENGSHKIVVGAYDVAGNKSKDSTTFTMDVHSWKYECNPFKQPNDTTKPLVWNLFTNTSQRNARIDDRLYNYDKTDTITRIPDKFVCTDFASVLAINFNGYYGLPPDPRGLYINNWHNIPMYTITLMRPTFFHQVTGIVIGDDATDINNWRIIDTESDSTYTKKDFERLQVYKMVVNFTYAGWSDIQQKFILDGIPMFEFIPDGNGWWEDSGYRNPEINLITKRK